MKRALALLLCVGCASAPARSAAPAESGAPARASLGWRAAEQSRREAELGADIDERLASRLGFYGERRVVAFVERVGRAISRSAERRDVSFTFRVIDDPAVNAFAAPGGYIYVTRGLLGLLGSEAELAAVLAHEVGHVDRRHSLREEAWADERALSWTRADTLRFYERSRDNEREADAFAIRALERAGRDPSALAAVLERLARAEAQSDEVDPADSSHPSIQARIARAEHAAGPARRPAPVEPLAVLDGLVYGANPRRGFLDGSSYVMAQSGLAFDVPDGWRPSVSGAALWALGPVPGSLLMLIRAQADESEPGADLRELRHTTVAGHRAVYGEVEVEESGLRGGLAVIRLDRELLMLVVITPRSPPSRFGVEALLGRFRPVRDARQLDHSPPRIAVVELRERTPLASLAVRSGLSLAAIAELNGLLPGATLRAGARVKLVR